MLIRPGSKLLFIGDSITDAGRTRNGDAPSEGLFDPLGRGYVTLVEALLTSTYPEHRIRVVNVGTSGHTVRDLDARWERDVIQLKPDWLSVMIGINDVWRQFDRPWQPELSVPLEEYERTLHAMLARARPGLKGLVLMTPFHIENLEADLMRRRMSEYAEVVRRAAPKFDAILVDTQAAFDAVLGVGKATPTYHSTALAWDRIHPNQAGHMVLARAFLKGVGYAW